MNHLDYINSFVWVDQKSNILCVSCKQNISIKRPTLLKITREHCNRHKSMGNYLYRCKNCKPSGSECGKWKGGKVMRRGYIHIHKSLVPEKYKSMCSNGGCYVPEHRLIVAMREDRCLSPIEHVHHIDFNSLNNSPNNLLLIDASSHVVITKLSTIIKEQKTKIETLENKIKDLTL
jgi:hypothetical protein